MVDPNPPRVLHYEGDGGNKITVMGDERNPLSIASVGLFSASFVVRLDYYNYIFNIGLDDGRISAKTFAGELSGIVIIERAGGMSRIVVDLSAQ